MGENIETMSQSLSQCKLDLLDISRLVNLSQSENVKKVLLAEKSKLEESIKELKVNEPEPEKEKVLPTITLKTYAWDQSDKFVKIYLTKSLDVIKSIPSGNIKLSSAESQHSVVISNLNGKNYQFSTPKLLHEVSSFTFRVKQKMLVLMLKKSKVQNWKYLSERDSLDKADKANDMDKKTGAEADPSASVMNMMKKMYDDGDDDMKRTIAKAWTEARTKNGDPAGLP